jgi:hypothetical protein
VPAALLAALTDAPKERKAMRHLRKYPVFHLTRASRCASRIALALFAAGSVGAACAGAAADAIPTIRVAADVPLGTGPAAARPATSNLQRALAGLTGPARLVLEPGEHLLTATAYTDPTCGNCAELQTPVPTTLGVQVSGHGIEIDGGDAATTVIHTGAGYGLLFDGCADCALRNVTVTGGARSPDGRATDGAVVVRAGTVRIEDCRIRDNIGDSATVAATVVGVAGIVGREGSDIRVRGCRIERNSWDGIALYHGARADIRDNVVDGFDMASGPRIGGGRGVGIGLTWDAHATIEGNLVRRYWKGIGTFVNAGGTVRHNIVEDIRTWGLAYWAAGDGRPSTVFEENVVYNTGACGVMIDRSAGGEPAPGALRGNVIVATGQNPMYDSGEPYCPQRPIARAAVPADFEIRDNLLYGSRQPGEWPRAAELDAAALLSGAEPLLSRLRARPALRHARFWTATLAEN